MSLFFKALFFINEDDIKLIINTLYIVNVYMTILWCLVKSLQRCVEAHLQCSSGTLCYRLRRLAEG